VSAFFHELFHSGIYKRTQGRITRQVTWVAIAATLLLGVWRLHHTLTASLATEWLYAVSFALLAIGMWVDYRLVNLPAFADFLIAVEAEMNKVSWPTRWELIRASVVVLVTIFALAGVLYAFDYIWATLFTWLHII
jgi:preprotein translocase subunit SecE